MDRGYAVCAVQIAVYATRMEQTFSTLHNMFVPSGLTAMPSGTFLGRFVEVKKKIDPFALNFKQFNTQPIFGGCPPVVGRLVKRTGRENPTLNPSFCQGPIEALKQHCRDVGFDASISFSEEAKPSRGKCESGFQDGKAAGKWLDSLPTFFPSLPHKHVTHFADAQKIRENPSPLGADLEIVVQ